MKSSFYFKNKCTICKRIFNTLKTYYIGFKNLELLEKTGIIAFGIINFVYILIILYNILII